MMNMRLLIITIVFLGIFIIPQEALSLTVREVAAEVMCTCGCSLVLKDCHMSCGLTWKEEIGKRILAGETKEEIISAYIKEFGRDSLVTPLQRLKGRAYQIGYLFLEEDMRVRMGVSLWEILLVPGNLFIWGMVLWLWRKNINKRRR